MEMWWCHVKCPPMKSLKNWMHEVIAAVLVLSWRRFKDMQDVTKAESRKSIVGRDDLV